MNVDFDQVLKIAQIVVIAGSSMLSLWLWLTSANQKSIEALRQDQKNGDAALSNNIRALASEIHTKLARDSEFHTRLSVLETKMQHVPTHGDLLGIRNEMRTLNEAVSAINERSETTQDMVQTIQRFLIEGGVRK